jgi:hypothetical protein
VICFGTLDLSFEGIVLHTSSHFVPAILIRLETGIEPIIAVCYGLATYWRTHQMSLLTGCHSQWTASS